jgi:hypothetical protein
MDEEIDNTCCKKAFVIVDGEYVAVDDTVFLNISEDFDGRDLYTFKYNGKTYSKNIIIK